MKDLIIQALTKALPQLESRVPKTKGHTKYFDINGISPIELVEFMRANNIPDNTYFAGIPNSYDSFDGIALAYDISIDTSELEREKFKNRVFTDIAYKEVFNLLKENGFIKVGYNTALLKDFKDTTVLKMFIAEDFDRLVKYYSLSFKKID